MNSVFQCLAASVFTTCGCTPAYLQSEESIRLGNSSCSLYKMATCVVPSVKNFDYTSCKCAAPCSLNTPEASLVQYGKYNRKLGGGRGGPNQELINMNVYAGLAYMQDIRLITNLEIPDYKLAQFLSDAGGAAGLFLGIRFEAKVVCPIEFLQCCDSDWML